MANEKRLIDAKPLMQNGWHLVKTGNSNVFLAQMSLADVPTVDAVEVVHGEWGEIYTCHGERLWGYKCSQCEQDSANKSNYCPNCGAKMGGDGNG